MLARDLKIGQRFTFPLMRAWVENDGLYTSDPISDRRYPEFVGKGKPVVLMRLESWKLDPNSIEYVFLEPAECCGRISYCGALAEAQLVEAPPDLLEALEGTLSWLSSYPGGGAMKAYEAVRTTIARIKGESNHGN